MVRIYVRENQKAIKNGQSRDTGNIGYIIHRTKTDNQKVLHRKLI